LLSTSFVAWKEAQDLGHANIGTAWYTISLIWTGLTSTTQSAAGSSPVGQCDDPSPMRAPHDQSPTLGDA